MRALLVAALLLGALALPAEAAKQGRLERRSITTAEGRADYLVYTPSTLRRGTRVPLYVMAHGCNMTAENAVAATGLNALAERERFVVLYADHVAATHPIRCWRFYDPATSRRDQGDPAVIAAETRAEMARLPIDPQRVYAMGSSSGAFMMSAVVAHYPDLFAALGLMGAGPYGPPTCLAQRVELGSHPDAPVRAQQAYGAMGGRARLIPVLEMHGAADTTVPPTCGEQAMEQWLRTANLVASRGAAQEGAIRLTPSTTRTRTEKGRRSAQVRHYRDRQGCLVAEKWTIGGMQHSWSGGPRDPAAAPYTDPTGPSGASVSWAFFSRYRRDATRLPCAEGRP